MNAIPSLLGVSNISGTEQAKAPDSRTLGSDFP